MRSSCLPGSLPQVPTVRTCNPRTTPCHRLEARICGRNDPFSGPSVVSKHSPENPSTKAAPALENRRPDDLQLARPVWLPIGRAGRREPTNPRSPEADLSNGSFPTFAPSPCVCGEPAEYLAPQSRRAEPATCPPPLGDQSQQLPQDRCKMQEQTQVHQSTTSNPERGQPWPNVFAHAVSEEKNSPQFSCTAAGTTLLITSPSPTQSRTCT
jgi:hypothetical protein